MAAMDFGIKGQQSLYFALLSHSPFCFPSFSVSVMSMEKAENPSPFKLDMAILLHS